MLKDQFGPRISSALTPAAVKNIQKSIGAYVDRNSDILLSMDMSRRYSFADGDRDVIYSNVHVPKEEMESAIAGSKSIYQGNKIQSNPFYATCVLTISALSSKGKDADAQMVMTYMSLQMYTSIHKGLYPYLPTSTIMDYTLAHLDNTFSIRQFPSIFAFIQDNTKTTYTTYKSRIQRCQDQDITWVVDALWTRLKGKMKKIAAKYYENHKSGNYLNADSESRDSEEFRELDNVSFAQDRLINKTYTALINRQYDRKFIRYSITSSDTSYQKLLNLIEDIIDDDGKDQRLRGTIADLIQYYLSQSGKPYQYIAKGDYIVFMRSAFGSNTEAPEMERIKSNIDTWLANNMYKYGRAMYGKTIQIQYRKAIYMFLVFMINYEAKVQ